MANKHPEDMYEAFDESTKCSVCLERYQDPRSLSCLHAFCLHCLEDIAKKAAPKKTICCPICRTPFQIPTAGVEGFPKAFLQASLAENVTRFQMLDLTGQTKCSVCSSETKTSIGKWFCTECVETLCDDCIIVHKRLLKSHVMLPCGNLKETEITNLMKQVRVKCEEHDEVIKFFCETDQSLLCVTCALLDHGSHSKKEVDKAAKVHEEALKYKLDELNQSKYRYEQYIRQTEDKKEQLENKVKTTEVQVSEWAKNCIKQIKDVEQKTKQEIKGKVGTVIEQVDNLKEKLQKDVLQLSSCAEHVNMSLVQGNSCNIIETSVKDMGKLEKILTELSLPPQLPSVSLSVEFPKIGQFMESKVVCTLQWEHFPAKLANSYKAPNVVPDNKIDENSVLKSAIATKKVDSAIKVTEIVKFKLPPWPKGPAGVCCSSDDDIIVCQFNRPDVKIYHPDGRLRDTVSVPSNANAEMFDVTCDRDSLYVTNRKSCKIFVFNIRGLKQLKSIGGYKDGICKFGDRLFTTDTSTNDIKYMNIHNSGNNMTVGSAVNTNTNTDLCFDFIDVNEHMIVASCNAKHKVMGININGSTKWVFGKKKGNGDEELSGPWGVAIDKEDRVLFVADPGNKRICVLNSDGQLMGHIDVSSYGMPLGLALNSMGHLIVSIRNLEQNHYILTIKYRCT